MKKAIALLYILPGLVITFKGSEYTPKVVVFLLFLVISGLLFAISNEFSFISKSLVNGNTKLVWVVAAGSLLVGAAIACTLG